MKSRLIVAFLGSFLVFSCSDEESESGQFYLIEIDSVGITEQISSSDTLQASFWGIVGGSSCYMFSHFEIEREGNDIYVEVYGTTTGASACLDVVIFLGGRILNISPPHELGPLRLNVKQPDGSQSVFVTNVISWCN